MKTVGKLIIIMLLIISCTEIIDLPLDESEIKLVVEGAITTDTTTHTIVLTQTTAYYYDKPPPPVTGANVVIDDGEKTVTLTERVPGFYQTPHNFYGVEGKTYTLNIKLATPLNGFTEFSATSYMNYVVELDSVKAEFRQMFGEHGMWDIRGWMQDPPSTDFYRFNILINRVVITTRIRNWIVTDDVFFNGQYVSGAPITFLNQNNRDERLASGDTLGVELFRINRDFYNFIMDAKSEISYSNPLFSGPGANVRGNISNGAIGYFTTYPISRAKYVIP